MADTTPVETAPVLTPSNEPGTTTAPATDNNSADVEAAKREAEQAKMRANQLENELKKLRDKQAEDDRKKLEENQEYKTLAEKLDAEVKQMREDQDRESRRLALTTATEAVLKDYPANVVKVAETAGLSLTDDSEAAITSLKSKLDTIKDSVGAAPVVNPNNSYVPTPEATSREALTAPGTSGYSPMAVAGAKGDNSVVHEYIGSLSAIKEMRKAAGLPD